MSRLRKYAVLAAVAAIVAALGISSAAFAQEATSAVPAVRLTHGGGGFGRGLCGEAGLDAAAKALGMSADELSTQLWGGETLSSLADKAGVDLQDVRDAVDAACLEAQKAAIQQAVTDGKLTQEHADWLLEGIDKGFLGGGMRGFDMGFGMGRGGFHGRGGFGRFSAPNGTSPSTTPSGFSF